MSEPRMRVKNAADEDQVKAGAKKDERDEERYHDALNNVMNTRDGRIVARVLLNACGMGIAQEPENPFTTTDSLTAYNCGRLFVGQSLHRDLMDACPTQYHLMEREARDLKTTENGNG
jgi:hypothetical protein